MSSTTFIDELVYRIGWALLDSVWIGTLAALLLAIALRIARTASSNARCLICSGALITTTLAMFGSAFLRTQASGVNGFAHRAEATSSAWHVARQTVSSESFAIDRTATNAPRITAERALPVVVAIWSCGVIAIAVWHLIGWLMLRRLRRDTTPASADLLEAVCDLSRRMRVRGAAVAISRGIDVPIVTGLLRPIVLVPASILTELSPAHIQAILAHELAHIRRHDYLINLIQIAIETLLFYHPAIWWISKQIRRERECACDELAASVCGSRITYARALASLEVLRGPRLALSVRGSGARGELLARVHRLLAEGARGQTRSSGGAIALLFITIALVAACAATRLAARPVQPRPEPSQATLPATSQPTVQRSAQSTTREEQMRLRYQSDLGRMEATSQQLAKLNLQIMQMEMKYGEKHPKLAQLKEVAAKFDDDYRAAKRDVLAMEQIAREKGIELNEPAATAGATTTSTTSRLSRGLRVSIGIHDFYLNGKVSDFQSIRNAFNEVPAEGKESTVVEVSIATPNVPAGRYFAYKSMIADQATQSGLPPITEVGVENDPPDGEPLAGEYYLGGEIARPGVYSLTARKITLKQALISAGAPHGEPTKLLITLVRTRGEDVTKPVENLPMADLFDGTAQDVYLKPNDQVMVTKEKLPAASQPK